MSPKNSNIKATEEELRIIPAPNYHQLKGRSKNRQYAKFQLLQAGLQCPDPIQNLKNAPKLTTLWLKNMNLI
jgi:hypothetical protein